MHLNLSGLSPAYVAADGAILTGDCLEIVDRLCLNHPEGLADMIFADPPYFLSNGGITCQNGEMVKVDKGAWDKSKGPEENHRFNLAWIGACQRLLRPNGTIWISGTHHVIYSVGYALQTLGFKILNSITWEKPNPPPNLACRYFTHSTETLLWAAKTLRSKHVFNYADMKQANGGKQMKSVWRLTAPARWEKSSGRHPTQKPLSVVERCILASTSPSQLVLDPFMGSGTTIVAAHRLKRRFVGIELIDDYTKLALSRLKSAKEQATITWSGT